MEAPLHTSKCESEKEMINDDNTVGICLPTLTNICGALIWLPFSITMVIVGLLYYNHCDYSQASIWLTISGAYCIIEFSIRIYIHFVSNEDYSELAKCRPSADFLLPFGCLNVPVSKSQNYEKRLKLPNVLGVFTPE